MKLLSVKEVQDKKQAELVRDIARTQEVKETLKKVTRELEEMEARFELALANQRVRWAKEEEEANHRLDILRIPIEERDKQSYDKYIEAERLEDLLYEKLDSLREKETELQIREEKLRVKELAMEHERELIKNPSAQPKKI